MTDIGDPISHKSSNFPFIRHASDSGAICPVGGQTLKLTAGATLNLGDGVYLSADFTVNKSTSAGNQNKRMGIVVGGTQTFGYVVTDSTQYGAKPAALIGEEVLVLYHGVIYVIVAAAITRGVPLILDTTTAGRVKAGAAIATGALSGAPAIGTLAATAGTLAIAAGAVAVTSVGANGTQDIAGAPALTGAPGIGTLAEGALTGDSMSDVIGFLLESSTGAGQIKKAFINLF